MKVLYLLLNLWKKYNVACNRSRSTLSIVLITAGHFIVQTLMSRGQIVNMLSPILLWVIERTFSDQMGQDQSEAQSRPGPVRSSCPHFQTGSVRRLKHTRTLRACSTMSRTFCSFVFTASDCKLSLWFPRQRRAPVTRGHAYSFCFEPHEEFHQNVTNESLNPEPSETWTLNKCVSVACCVQGN